MRIGEVGEWYAGPVAASSVVPIPRRKKRINWDQDGGGAVKPVSEGAFVAERKSRTLGYTSTGKRREPEDEGENIDFRL